jgi:hypothetical protein
MNNSSWPRALLCVLVSLGSLGACSSQEGNSAGQVSEPIIDMHLHAHPPEEFLQHRLGAPNECALPTVLPLCFAKT